MRRAIREHLRDFLAIAVLFFLALAATGVILVKQSTTFPSWIPIFGSNTFELRAEFGSSQAITPGQGQTAMISGVKVGTISGVDLEHGDAVVTMQIDDKYASLIHRDATLLLRPRSGLQDMTIEIDPGTSKESLPEGSTVPLAQTQPNVQPDQILASLDGDTRDYLQLLLEAAGSGLGGRGPKLAADLKRLDPTARDLARIGGALAKRRQNIKHVITNLALLSQALGRSDTQLAGFVRSSNDVLGSFARQEGSIRSTLQELPGALRETRAALGSSDRLALQLGPASTKLSQPLGQPDPCSDGANSFACGVGPALRESRPLFRKTVGPIRSQIRPFAHAVQKPLKHVKQGAGPLGEATTGLARGFKNLNLALNALAYNPPGAAQEGYLFWASWLNHDTNAIFFTQDAGGPLRHGLVLANCSTVSTASGVAQSNADVKTLLQLSVTPTQQQIHDADPNCPPPFFPFP